MIEALALIAAVVGIVAMMAAVLAGEILAHRRVKRENERRQMEYEIQKIDAKQRRIPPPCPPNRVALG